MPMIASGASCVDLKSPSIAASLTGWYFVTSSPLRSPVGKITSNDEDERDDRTGVARSARRNPLFAVREQIIRADTGDDEAARKHRAGQHVRELPDKPRRDSNAQIFWSRIVPPGPIA